jgi:hypothetical protein
LTHFCVSFLLPSVDLMETLQVPTDLTDSTTTLLVYTKYITLPNRLLELHVASPS